MQHGCAAACHAHNQPAPARHERLQDLTLEQFGQLSWALQRQEGRAHEGGAAEEQQQQQQEEGEQP